MMAPRPRVKTRETIFALVAEIDASGQNLVRYCRARGLNPALVHWRAYALGIRISVELRKRRVLRGFALKRDHPHWTWTRISLDCGFANLSAFRRAQRRLKERWGYDVEQELFASGNGGP